MNLDSRSIVWDLLHIVLFFHKVRDIQTKIAEAEFEHNRLENENIQLQQELVAKVKILQAWGYHHLFCKLFFKQIY